MGLQKHFEDFNNKIKMDYNELAELAEKRDILINKLRDSGELPSFEQFNQGSYSMCTGIVPLDKDYDIDVGLRFKVSKDEYKPLELKEKICDILKNHTDYGTKIKHPCVTVSYKKDGKLAYHVDLVVYAYEDKDNKESQMYLARGKEYSDEESKFWEETDPIELQNKIIDKYSDSKQRSQYRRIIRYMKRWKNISFNSGGDSEPPGIGITLLAYEKFIPEKYDYLESEYKFDDLQALISFVGKVKDMFIFTGYSQNESKFLYRIEYDLPVTPYTNVFCNMTDIQMTGFKEKIDRLLEKLQAVEKEDDVVEQCSKLNKIFGEDFVVQSKESQSKAQRDFVPPSSASGRGI